MPLNFGGFLGRFTERAGAETLGFGIGVALAETLRPEATALGQEAWEGAPFRAVDPEVAAAIVAEAVELMPWGRAEAAKAGIDEERFGAMVDEARNAPGLGELLRLRRRRAISDEDFGHGLDKAKLERRWQAPMRELLEDRLQPATIATSVQRGIMPNPGLLPVGPPSAVGRVPPMPVVALDPIEEARDSGINRDRLAALTRIVGLPPAPGELLQLLNRGEIDTADYYRGISEGNTRNEWAPFLLELRRRLLTPHEYVEARLRGWIDDAAMHQGAALTGMQPADTDLLARLSGRPISFHQAFIGQRRGGRYDGPTGEIEHGFLRSLQESNVRPEWYNLAWAQRYVYPSAFVLRQLTASGELSADETEQVLLYEGWEPGFARKVAKRWATSDGGAHKEETKAELADEYAGGYLTEKEFRTALAEIGYTGHTVDLLVHLNDARRIKRFREKAVDAINGAFVAFKLDDARATAELAELSVTGEAASLLLTVWRKQRVDSVRLLTPAQLKRAWTRGLLTEDEALEALRELHYSDEDARILLHE